MEFYFFVWLTPPLSRIYKGYGVPGSRKASWHQVWKRTVGWQVFRSSRSRTRILGIRDRLIRPIDPPAWVNFTSILQIIEKSAHWGKMFRHFLPKVPNIAEWFGFKSWTRITKKRYRFELCKLLPYLKIIPTIVKMSICPKPVSLCTRRNWWEQRHGAE